MDRLIKENFTLLNFLSISFPLSRSRLFSRFSSASFTMLTFAPVHLMFCLCCCFEFVFVRLDEAKCCFAVLLILIFPFNIFSSFFTDDIVRLSLGSNGFVGFETRSLKWPQK